MLKEQILEKITSQLAEAIKASPFQDIETNLKAVLQASLEKLDLISREEFDIQQKVLLQTRMKLDELEKIVKTLEQNK